MNKPTFQIPTMQQVNALPWNGFTVASTFSGGGGSSLGYRMAGFRVAWANEFVEAARDCYRANASAQTIIDGRDIRTIQAAEVLEAIQLRVGELSLLDGSPPCASFSTAGRRSALWANRKSILTPSNALTICSRTSHDCSRASGRKHSSPKTLRAWCEESPRVRS